MKKNNTFSAGKREFMRRMRAGALEDEEQMKIFQLSNPKKLSWNTSVLSIMRKLIQNMRILTIITRNLT